MMAEDTIKVPLRSCFVTYGFRLAAFSLALLASRSDAESSDGAPAALFRSANVVVPGQLAHNPFFQDIPNPPEEKGGQPAKERSERTETK